MPFARSRPTAVLPRERGAQVEPPCRHVVYIGNHGRPVGGDGGRDRAALQIVVPHAAVAHGLEQEVVDVFGARSQVVTSAFRIRVGKVVPKRVLLLADILRRELVALSERQAAEGDDGRPQSRRLPRQAVGEMTDATAKREGSVNAV